MANESSVPASLVEPPSQSTSLKGRRSELPDVAAPPTRRPAALRLVTPIVDASDAAVPATPDMPIWDPTERGQPARWTSSAVIHDSLHPTSSLSPAAAAELVELLTAPIPSATSHNEAAEMREARVCAFIGQLGTLDAYHLDRRLRRDADDDPIVRAFRRLIPTRRQRIIAALEASRRGRGTRATASP